MPLKKFFKTSSAVFDELKQKEFFSKKNIILILVLSIIVLSLPIGIRLAQNQTQLKSRAQDPFENCQVINEYHACGNNGIDFCWNINTKVKNFPQNPAITYYFYEVRGEGCGEYKYYCEVLGRIPDQCGNTGSSPSPTGATGTPTTSPTVTTSPTATPDPSACNLSKKTPALADACAACIIGQAQGAVASIKSQPGNVVCSDAQAISHWCNGGVSDAGRNDCQNIGANTCKTLCNFDNIARCDESQVNLSVSSPQPQVGQNFTLSVSGSQGSTYIEERFSDPSAVSCRHDNLPNSNCKALKAGTFDWWHGWRNTAPNDFNNKGPLCEKKFTFTIGGQSCSELAPPTASSFKIDNAATSGIVSPGQHLISWDSVQNASKYAVRVDNLSNSWKGNCSVAQESGDVCNDSVSGTSFSHNFENGKQYRFWIHSVNSCGQLGPQLSQFTVNTVVKPNPPTITSASCTNGVLNVSWTGQGPKYKLRAGKNLTKAQILDGTWDASHPTADDIKDDDLSQTSFSRNVGANNQSYIIWLHTDNNGVLSDRAFANNDQPVTCASGTSPTLTSTPTGTTSPTPTGVVTGNKCTAETANFLDRWSLLVQIALYDKDYDCDGNRLVDIIDYNIWRNKRFNLLPNP